MIKAKPQLEITILDGVILPFPVREPQGYTVPHNEGTCEAFPMCCDHHKGLLKSAQEWFNKFPMCCDEHRLMVQKVPIEKEQWQEVPMNITKAVNYTEFAIEHRILLEDWYEDITDYIQYVELSLGMPALGLHIYLIYIRGYLRNNPDGLPKDRIQRLLEFMEGYFREPKEERTDWNVLNSIYEKWLKEFPFDLPFFSDLKEQYHRPQLFANGDFKRNRYINTLRFKMHTRNSLIDKLVNLTDSLLCSMNAMILHDQGKLTDPAKLQMEIAISKRRSELQRGYSNDSPNGEHRYRKMLKAWFKDEQEFIQAVQPLLKKSNTDETDEEQRQLEETTKKVIRGLNEYRFDEYHIKKGFDLDLLRQLIREKAGREQLPYCIALMDETKYLEYFDTEFSNGKKKITAIKLAKVFRTQERKIGETNIRQHRYSLVKPAEKRWNAHEYKETVKQQLQGQK